MLGQAGAPGTLIIAPRCEPITLPSRTEKSLAAICRCVAAAYQMKRLRRQDDQQRANCWQPNKHPAVYRHSACPLKCHQSRKWFHDRRPCSWNCHPNHPSRPDHHRPPSHQDLYVIAKAQIFVFGRVHDALVVIPIRSTAISCGALIIVALAFIFIASANICGRQVFERRLLYFERRPVVDSDNGSRWLQQTTRRPGSSIGNLVHEAFD